MSIAISPATRLVRLAAAVAFLLLLAALLAGCSSSAEDAPQSASAPVAEFDSGGNVVEEASDSTNPSAADRSIIITGSMYMTVENPLAAADKAATIVKDAGGRVDARGETAPDGGNGGSAELTLRIPTDRLDAVVEDLRALGTVDEFTTTSSDVTNEVTDLDAHISTLRASTERIEALLLEAKDITDIIKLEDELAARQAELESLEAQQRGLTDQVSLSTIQLSLTTVPVVVVVDDSRATFVDGIATGWNALVSFFSVAFVVFGVLLPWLILLAVIALVVIATARMRKSRQSDVPPPADAQVAEATTAP